MILHIRPTELTTGEQRSYGFRASLGEERVYADGFASAADVMAALEPDVLVLTLSSLCPAFALARRKGEITGVRIAAILLSTAELGWPEWS